MSLGHKAVFFLPSPPPSTTPASTFLFYFYKNFFTFVPKKKKKNCRSQNNICVNFLYIKICGNSKLFSLAWCLDSLEKEK